MKMEKSFMQKSSVIAVVLAGLLSVGMILAQEPAAVPAPAPAPVVSPEISWIVIPVRAQEEIAGNLANARAAYDAARVWHDKALEMQVQLEPLILTKKAEIDSLNRGLELAKKEKREVDATALEVGKKKAEQLRDMLIQQKELRISEVDAAQAEMDWATAAQKAFEDEKALVERKASRDADPSANPAAVELMIKEIETRTLENQKIQAEKLQKMAEQYKQVVDRRMKFAEAVTKLGLGK
ncbi:MAG: hypothetical protein GYA46_07725 [candidate division Zixibacteria bacterium]|nr:hypothetical protein [candidate division Zixibacteria bacterium]